MYQSTYLSAAPAEGYYVHFPTNQDDPSPIVIAHCFTPEQAKELSDDINRTDSLSANEAIMWVQHLAAMPTGPTRFVDPKQTYQISYGIMQAGSHFKNMTWDRQGQVVNETVFRSWDASRDEAIRESIRLTKGYEGSRATIHNSGVDPDECGTRNLTGYAEKGIYKPQLHDRMKLIKLVEAPANRYRYLWFTIHPHCVDYATKADMNISCSLRTPEGQRLGQTHRLAISHSNMNDLHNYDYLRGIQDTLHWLCRESL